MTHIASGNTAPNFALKDSSGTEYLLASLLDKGPVVAAFFKVSCPVCQFTFPFLERLFRRYGGNAGTFLGVSQDDAKATKKFAAEFGVTFPVVLDEKGYPASNAYGLTNVPTILLIDPDATVKTVCIGFDKAALEAIAADLAERGKLAPFALFRPDESVPAHKPG